GVEVKAGQVGAEAGRVAASEVNVRGGGAVDVDRGVGELVVVEVGGPQHEHHRVARRQGDAAQLDVLLDDAGDDHDRRLPPHELLDDGGDAAGVVDQLLAAVGMVGQVDDHAVERRRHRVE